MTTHLKIGTTVLIDPTPGPMDVDALVPGVLKGHIPDAEFGLIAWLMTDDGRYFHGYECWWAEAVPMPKMPDGRSSREHLLEVIGFDPPYRASYQINPDPEHLTEPAEYRQNMVAAAQTRLQHLAWKAYNVMGRQPDDFTLVCIEVDSRWRGLVERLMPGNEPEWQAGRDSGQTPLANGIVTADLCEELVVEFPGLADVLMATPEDGRAKCIVLADGGCSVLEIEPKREDREVH